MRMLFLFAGAETHYDKAGALGIRFSTVAHTLLRHAQDIAHDVQGVYAEVHTMLMQRLQQAILLSMAVSALGLPAQAPSFTGGSTLTSGTLGQWTQVGTARWAAQGDEIVASGGPGLLVSKASMQDAGMYLQFKCDGTCNTGVLMRMVKSGDGYKAQMIAIEGSETAAYAVTLDAQGEITDKQKLRSAGGTIRFAPPAPPPGSPQRAGGMPAMRPAPAGVTLPIQRPQQGVTANDWNDVEVLLDADILRAFVDGGGGQASGATDGMDGFGPIALYSGGSGTLHLRAVSYRDLAMKDDPIEKVGAGFRMQRLSPFYYGWSAAAADFNEDGKLDIVSGPYIYYGPDYTRSREIYPAVAVNPSVNYSMDDWVEHADDYTGDGWPDVLTTSHAGGGKEGAMLYINPKGESRRWQKVQVVAPIDSEATVVKDVDGDGKLELVYYGGGYMCWAKPDPANPEGKWIVHKVSDEGPWPAHGIGAGDVNGDGRVDILGADGWWEHPAGAAADGKWPYHPVAFGDWGRTSPGGAEIAVYDVNGDGVPDVVTTLQAHGWGLAWFEGKKSASGQMTFIRHDVMGHTAAESAGGVVFTEPHGSAVADMDGDGIPDYVVGKRYWSHLDDEYDPDPYGPAVLYWYKTVRDKSAPGGARLEPHLIHNRSGVGSDVLPVDLNKDGVMDVVTSTRSGTYIFWGEKTGRGR